MILFAAALAALQPAAAAPPAPPAPPPAAAVGTRSLGVDLARLMNNEALTMRQTRRALDIALPKALAGDPHFKTLETAYPGIIAAAVVAMRPVLERHTLARLPDIWDRLGGVLARHLTDAELRGALAFYASPTGRWVMDQVAEGTDLTAALSRQLADPAAEVTVGDLRDGIARPGAALAARRATTAQTRDVIRFGLSPAGRKLRTISPELAQVVTAWSNEKDPVIEAEVERTVTEAMEAFVARTDAAPPSP